MLKIRRKIYKRGNSYETTLPKQLFLGKNLKSLDSVFFKFSKNCWFLSFNEKNFDNINIIKRKIYQRSSSFEITIPKHILFNLDLKKQVFVVFEIKNSQWSVNFEYE